jgi:hypothetical protein
VRIEKNTGNVVVLSLKEKQTKIAPVWLFHLQHIISGDNKYFNCADNSQYEDRYNRFLITDNSSEDPTIGKINFSTGQYTYKVYEMDAAGYDTSLGLLCETGMCEVVNSTRSTEKKFTVQSTKNNKVFKG